MNPHQIKCNLGLHDWNYEVVAYGDITVLEKTCQWCREEDIEV